MLQALENSCEVSYKVNQIPTYVPSILYEYTWD